MANDFTKVVIGAPLSARGSIIVDEGGVLGQVTRPWATERGS